MGLVETTSTSIGHTETSPRAFQLHRWLHRNTHNTTNSSSVCSEFKRKNASSKIFESRSQKRLQSFVWSGSLRAHITKTLPGRKSHICHRATAVIYETVICSWLKEEYQGVFWRLLFLCSVAQHPGWGQNVDLHYITAGFIINLLFRNAIDSKNVQGPAWIFCENSIKLEIHIFK